MTLDSQPASFPIPHSQFSFRAVVRNRPGWSERPGADTEHAACLPFLAVGWASLGPEPAEPIPAPPAQLLGHALHMQTLKFRHA